MATVVPTVVGNESSRDGSIMVVTWTPLTSSNVDGTPVKFPEWADRTWTVTGTFGAGGTITLQGSNDGTNWFTLSNAAGAAAATFTAAGGKATIELPMFVRPLESSGDGTTSLTVIMVARRANPMRA